MSDSSVCKITFKASYCLGLHRLLQQSFLYSNQSKVISRPSSFIRSSYRTLILDSTISDSTLEISDRSSQQSMIFWSISLRRCFSRIWARSNDLILQRRPRRFFMTLLKDCHCDPYSFLLFISSLLIFSRTACLKRILSLRIKYTIQRIIEEESFVRSVESIIVKSVMSNALTASRPVSTRSNRILSARNTQVVINILCK